MSTILRLASLALLCSTQVFGQYVPHSAQNFQFAPVYNPAFSGIENFIDLKAGHRYQWSAFKDNAPQFTNVSISFRLKEPLELRENALRPSRTDFSALVPKRKLSIYGMGFSAYHEEVGPIRRIGAGGTLAIHMPVTDDIFVAAGGGLMYESTGIQGDRLYWGEMFDPNDPVYQRILTGSARHSEVWSRIGLLVYGDNFYAGGTLYPVKAQLSSSDVAVNQELFKGNFQFGLSFPLNEDFVLKPSVWALWQEDNTFVVDYTAKFFMQERIWFGLTYRDVKAGVAAGGFHINDKMSASYAYEFPMGRLRGFAGGSHEIVVAYRFRNYNKVLQRTW